MTARRGGRDPEHSHAAILEAAEEAFAELGYESATLDEIGERAGFSRGMPSYCFGTKEKLYGAVVKRALADGAVVFAPALELTAALAEGPLYGPRREETEEALEHAVGECTDFLAGRPAFARLMLKETLAGSSRSGRGGPLPRPFESELARLADSLPGGAARHAAVQAVLSAIALCLFPFEHEAAIARGLGVRVGDPHFLAMRKRHVTTVVVGLLIGSDA